MNKTTDIDHLHKVVNKEIQGRGIGKTYAKCHEIAGLLELKDELGLKYIICMVSHWRDFYYIAPMLGDVLTEHEFTCYDIHEAGQRFVVNNLQIIFFPEEHFEYRTRGYSDFALIFMRHQD